MFEPGAVDRTPGADLTVMNDPIGIAIHPRTGDIYVADRVENRVTVFAGPTMRVGAVTPGSGPTTGGTAVTITGSNLGAVSGVRFGSGRGNQAWWLCRRRP